MASYHDLITIAGNNGFQDRIKYALTSAAISVYNELSSTTGHATRVDYARSVLGGNLNLPSASLAVLTNTSIATGASLSSPPYFAIIDSDIQFAVNSLWDALAGA